MKSVHCTVCNKVSTVCEHLEANVADLRTRLAEAEKREHEQGSKSLHWKQRCGMAENSLTEVEKKAKYWEREARDASALVMEQKAKVSEVEHERDEFAKTTAGLLTKTKDLTTKNEMLTEQMHNRANTLRLMADQALMARVGVVEKTLSEVESRGTQIIKGLLPLNGLGECFMCANGNRADEEHMHFDSDNVWGGDQKCLWHDHYKEARGFVKLSPME